MELQPEDPRITAYLLGELPVVEAAAVGRAIAADPALQAAANDLASVRDFLVENLAPQPGTLLPGQRQSIRQAMEAPAIVPLPHQPRQRRSWLLPFAAAAAITFLAAILTWHSQSPAPATAQTKPTPAAAPVAAPPTSIQIQPATAATASSRPRAQQGPPMLRPRAYFSPTEAPSLDLPVQTGDANLADIRSAIFDNHQLPDRNAVRLEEILNHFCLRPAGVTVVARSQAIGRHPDERDQGLTTHAATIATEAIACPWKPSSSLVLVSLRGNPNHDCEIKATYQANPASVLRYRLLGYASLAVQESTALPTRLAANSTNMLVLEVEPASTANDLGQITWEVDGRPVAPLDLVRQPAAEPSDDARFAALICTYAQWLAGETSELIDRELLAALTREIASQSLSGDRAEFLELIEQSLHL